LNKLGAFAKEIRDIFLKSPAWEALKDRAPDPHYLVDESGRITTHERAMMPGRKVGRWQQRDGSADRRCALGKPDERDQVSHGTKQGAAALDAGKASGDLAKETRSVARAQRPSQAI
jgi:hypothetical protein